MLAGVRAGEERIPCGIDAAARGGYDSEAGDDRGAFDGRRIAQLVEFLIEEVVVVLGVLPEHERTADSGDEGEEAE